MFSFGVLLNQICGGLMPFQHTNHTRAADERALCADIVRGLRPCLACHAAVLRENKPLVPLIRRCWNQQPEERPDASAVASTLRSIAACAGVVDLAPRGW